MQRFDISKASMLKKISNNTYEWRDEELFLIKIDKNTNEEISRKILNSINGEILAEMLYLNLSFDTFDRIPYQIKNNTVLINDTINAALNFLYNDYYMQLDPRDTEDNHICFKDIEVWEEAVEVSKHLEQSNISEHTPERVLTIFANSDKKKKRISAPIEIPLLKKKENIIDII